MLTFMMMPLGIGQRLPLMLCMELLNAPPHQVLPAGLHGGPHGARVQWSDLALEILASSKTFWWGKNWSFLHGDSPRHTDQAGLQIFSFFFDGLWLRDSKALHSFVFLMCFLVVMTFLFRIRQRFYQHPAIECMAVPPGRFARPRSPIHWARQSNQKL